MQSFPQSRAVIQISTEGGTEPVWSRDGRELFYRNVDQLLVVAVDTEADLRPGRPRLLFEQPYALGTVGNPNFDVSLDGQSFLMVSGDAVGLTVELNWVEELKRLVPTN